MPISCSGWLQTGYVNHEWMNEWMTFSRSSHRRLKSGTFCDLLDFLHIIWLVSSIVFAASLCCLEFLATVLVVVDSWASLGHHSYFQGGRKVISSKLSASNSSRPNFPWNCMNTARSAFSSNENSSDSTELFCFRGMQSMTGSKRKGSLNFANWSLAIGPLIQVQKLSSCGFEYKSMTMSEQWVDCKLWCY